MKRRHPLIHLMLACMLLFYQQLSLAHLLNHAMRSNTGQVALLPDTANLPPAQLLVHESCQECLSFAHWGSALPTHAADCAIFASHAYVAHYAMTDFLSVASPSPFLSRAPPVKKINLS